MVIPADWKEVRLGDLGLFSKGAGIKKDDVVSVGVPCVRYGQLYTEHHSVIRSIRSFVSTEVASTSRPLVAGEILFAGSGETKAEIGKCVAYVDEIGAVAGGDLVILTPKQCSSIFLGYALNSPEVVRQKMARAQGDAVVHISAASLATVIVGLPPLKEQEAIAEALSDADAAIESLDALIAKKRDVKQAAMQQLLTGRTRLPGFTADWKEVRLGEICEFVKTIALSRAQLEADHGVGCIHYGDIHTKFNDRLDCSNIRLPMAESGMVVGVPRLKVGDLVIADASEDMNGVGKGIEILGIPEYGVVAGLHTAVLRPQAGHFVKGFLGQLQHMPKFREQARVLASGLKVYGLSKTSISKISVEIPPLKEQEAIAEALSVMDDELEALSAQVSKLRMVKEGMMQDLLTGKVRLV